MNDLGEKSPLLVHIGWQVFILSFLAFIFGAGAVSRGSLIGFVGLVGVAFSSFHLCSMWAVLGPGRYTITASLSLLTCLMVAAAALFGIWASAGMFATSDFVRLLACCPLVWVIHQLPFWVLRILFHWRICHARFQNHALSIGELIGLTTMTALSLGVAKYAAQDLQWQNQRFSDFVQFITTIIISLKVSFIFVCLPLMCFALKPVTFNSNSRLFTVYVFSLVLTLVGTSIFTIESGVGLMILAISVSVGVFLGSVFYFHSQNGVYLTTSREVASKR